MGLILVLLPFLTMLVVDVNVQGSSAKSIIDCKGKEGKVTVSEEWTCHENGKIDCQKKTEDCSKGKAKGDGISAKIVFNAGKKVGSTKGWQCTNFCKKGKGCSKGSFNTVEEKDCAKFGKEESGSDDEEAKEGADDKDEEDKKEEEEEGKEEKEEEEEEVTEAKDETKVAEKENGKDAKEGEKSGD